MSCLSVLVGLAVLWITSNDDNIAADPGMSPWSQVKLVPSRALHTLTSSPAVPLKTAALPKIADEFATAVALLSGDISSFMVAAFDQIHRVSRFGDTPHPNTFDRLDGRANFEVSISERSTVEDDINYKGFITCLSTTSIQSYHPSSPSKENSSLGVSTMELMLVGRSDGGIDLYQLIHSHPICSWNITDYEKASSSTKSKGVSMPRNASVVTLRWCPGRNAAFIAIDNHGTLYFFDLLENFDAPIAIDSLNANISSLSLAVESYLSSSSPLNSASPKGPAYPTLLDVSQSRAGGRTASIAVVDMQTKSSKSSAASSSPGASNVKARRIREEVFRQVDNEEVKFTQLLQERVRMNDSNIVAHVVKQSSRK
jgi:hypothetical protein